MAWGHHCGHITDTTETCTTLCVPSNLLLSAAPSSQVAESLPVCCTGLQVWPPAAPGRADRRCLTLVGAVGRQAVRLLQRAEVDTLASLALPIQANALHLDDVVCILCQVPQHTGTVGGVHLTDEALHLSVLPLAEERAVSPGRLLPAAPGTGPQLQGCALTPPFPGRHPPQDGPDWPALSIQHACMA